MLSDEMLKFEQQLRRDRRRMQYEDELFNQCARCKSIDCDDCEVMSKLEEVEARFSN